MIDDDIRMLRESADRLFAEAEPAKALRRGRDARDFDALSRGVWDGMVQLGLPGILVPEEQGGAGLGYRASAEIARAMGRALAMGPFVSTAVMGAVAIRGGGNDRLKAALLPQIADGSLIVALAGEETPRHAPLDIAARARRVDGGIRISGRKLAVIDGNIAGKFIVAARDADAGDGLCLFLVDASAAGLAVKAALGVDSHPLVTLELGDVPVDADDLICGPDGASALLEQVYDAGRLHLAAEMLGVAEEAFDRTVDYLKTREQFGRRIGEFQALQHRAAILFGEIEIARSVVAKAAAAHDGADPRFAEYVSLAKAKVGDVAVRATTEAVQLHGGIGVTDDFDMGFYLKRARGAGERLGDSAFHLERYAQIQGL